MLVKYSLLPLAALLYAAVPMKAASACDAVIAATLKIMQVPTHLYTTVTGTKPRSSETIYFNGVTYLKVAGQWRKSAFAQEPLAQQKKESEDKIGTCAVVRDELVGGEPATLYKVRNKEAEVDAQMWISKSRGLPLKQGFDLDGGRMEIRYEYTNVSAPAVK
jgi:hypothetical protein